MDLYVWIYTWASLVKGGRGVDLAEILHILLTLPEFSPLFCPNMGGQLPPPPAPLTRTPMDLYVRMFS